MVSIAPFKFTPERRYPMVTEVCITKIGHWDFNHLAYVTRDVGSKWELVWGKNKGKDGSWKSYPVI